MLVMPGNPYQCYTTEESDQCYALYQGFHMLYFLFAIIVQSYNTAPALTIA